VENENQRSYIGNPYYFYIRWYCAQAQVYPVYRVQVLPVKKYFLSGYRNRVEPNFLYIYCLNTHAIVYAEVTVCTFRYC
jgi:hypothetical protein